MKILNAIDDFLSIIEDWALIILLFFLIFTAFMQVILRNVFFTGFMWADILMRNSVLWIALLGASTATKERKHIAIDVVSRFFSIRKKYIIEIILSAISMYVCHLLAAAALVFIRDERGAGSVVVFDIPTWCFLLIIPFAFYSIAFRFFVRALKRAVILIKGVS